MTQIDYHSIPQALPFKSQRAGMIVFGIIFCLIGLVLFLAALFVPMALITSTAMNWRQIVPLEIIYILSALFFLWLGIDNFRTRRWVRPVCIVGGALSLVIGLFATISSAVQWRMMREIMQDSAGGSGATPGLWIGILVGGGMVLSFYLVLPGLIWWFYRRESVRETVWHFDPSPSWTDGLPLSVLTAAFVTLGFAFTEVFIITRASLPFFTVRLIGTSAVIVTLLMILFNLLAAVLLVKRLELGWWLALIVPAIHLISQNVARHTLGLRAEYGMEELTRAQRDIISASPLQTPFALTVILIMFLVAWFAFLAYVRPRLKGADHTGLAGLPPRE